MSFDPGEAEREVQYEAFVEELYEEHKEQAIDEFVTERLRSYYLANPDVMAPALQMYKEGRELEQVSSSAAVVFYVSATDVAMKSALLRPVVHGLVHSESLAGLVADLTVKQTGLDRFRNLLFGVLEEYGEIDLANFRIEGHKAKLWDEMRRVQEARNALVHRGRYPSSEEIDLAKEVATIIIGNFLVNVVQSLGLRLVKGGYIEPEQ